MNKHDLIRAWKDPGFRARLTPQQRSELPESPAGLPMAGLEEPDLAGAVGGRPDNLSLRAVCATNFCAPFSVIDVCDWF
jgi:mersacidin/lichenicidin family type 2 lantibiotic